MMIGFAPALVAGLERHPHHLDIADAFERVVGAAAGQFDQMGNEIAFDLRWIDEMGHAEAVAPFLLGFVQIDADDHAGADQSQALDDIEADAAEAEDDAIAARFHLGGVDDRADAGGDAAADIADLVEGRVLADFGQRDFGSDGEVREGGAAHIMMDHPAPVGEAAGAIGHEALALGDPDFLAEIGLGVQAIFAFAAFGRVERDDVIADLQRFHAAARLRRTMPAPSWPMMAGNRPSGIGAGNREFIGMADAGRLDLHQHLALLRTFEIDFDDLQRLGLLEGNGGAGFHFGSRPPAKEAGTIMRGSN